MPNIEDFKTNNLVLPSNFNADRLDSVVSQATNFDLREAFIRDDFYFAYLDGIGKQDIEQRWLNLKNKLTYEYNGRKYTHQGVDLCILYWAYARIIEQSNLVVTPKGVNTRQNAGYVNTDPTMLAKLCNEYRRMGGVTFDDIQRYIRRVEDYSEFDINNEPKDDYSGFNLDIDVVRPSRNPYNTLR